MSQEIPGVEAENQSEIDPKADEQEERDRDQADRQPRLFRPAVEGPDRSRKGEGTQRRVDDERAEEQQEPEEVLPARLHPVQEVGRLEPGEEMSPAGEQIRRVRQKEEPCRSERNSEQPFAGRRPA